MLDWYVAQRQQQQPRPNTGEEKPAAGLDWIGRTEELRAAAEKRHDEELRKGFAAKRAHDTLDYQKSLDGTHKSSLSPR